MTIPSRGQGGTPAPGRTGLVLREPLPWPQLRQIAETAEDTGYEAVFVPESAGREAFSTLTGLALATTRIDVGTGVVTVRSRAPATTAMAAATVQDLSGGRLILGLGSGMPSGRPDEPGSVEFTRRYVAAVRALLAGRGAPPDDVLGSPASHLELPVESGPPPPIWLAALGDRMIALAGEVADGVLLNWCTHERVAAARAVLVSAAERAGRDPGSVTVAVYVRACLGLDLDVAMAALMEMSARYAAIPHYRKQFELMGLGHEASERLVRSVAVAGGRRDAVARFAEYRRAGADLVLCYPVAALDGFSSVLGTVLGAAPSPSLEA